MKKTNNKSILIGNRKIHKRYSFQHKNLIHHVYPIMSKLNLKLTLYKNFVNLNLAKRKKKIISKQNGFRDNTEDKGDKKKKGH